MKSGLRFQGKVAIVTGGCSGIGKGCVEVFAEHGGFVVILDKAEENASLSNLPGPGKVKYMKCDVTNEQQIKDCVANIVSEFGKIDCLINNAGVHSGVVTIDDVSVDDFRRIFEINVVSIFTMSKYVLPYLRETKGSIVNISSVSGTEGEAKCPTYCATKGAIPALAKALAIDEARNGVRVNTICPGPINTPLLQALAAKGNADQMKRRMQLERFGETREIGMACLFLATDATFSTGINLMCNGGSNIGYGIKH